MKTRKFLDAGWSSSKLLSHCPYYRGIQGETLQLIDRGKVGKLRRNLGSSEFETLFQDLGRHTQASSTSGASWKGEHD